MWEFDMPEHVPGRRTSGLGVLDRVLGVLHVIVIVVANVVVNVVVERAKRD